ncbi:hypothetical protein [Secundilactobacillus collinoides]|uniref:Uncharacterized protein n=1 Tax=Secundilactobacillus collinoides TaxID=33960 RepID=A0A166FNB6_SECCO|nr:hypothetical protein [Secundilactobacillus collinoides]KZL35618.1 hypothetical protein TY91_16310 [Secundilactobacillus collinoides]
MKMNRIVIVGLTAVTLGVSVPVIGHAKALPGLTSHYWWHPRHMHVRKPVTALKFSGLVPDSLQKPIAKKRLKVGTAIVVQSGGLEWDWNVAGRGMVNNRKQFWMVQRTGSGWMRQ